MDRSSRSPMFFKTGGLKHFANFTSQISQENTCVRDPKACSFIKMRLQDRCLPVKFAKFLRTHILKNTYERLLLTIKSYMILAFKKSNKFYCVQVANVMKSKDIVKDQISLTVVVTTQFLPISSILTFQ